MDSLSIRLRENDPTISEIDSCAAMHGLTRANLVRHALNLFMDLEPEFLKKVAAYAPGVPVGHILRAFATRRLAEESAETKVWGRIPRQLMEFTQTRGPEGLAFLPFDELFALLANAHESAEAQKRATVMRRTIARKLSAGLPLDDEELELDLADQRAAAAVRRPSRDTAAGARIDDGDDIFDANKWQVDKL